MTITTTLGPLSKIYQATSTCGCYNGCDRANYAAMVSELDARFVHVSSTCHKQSILSWLRERNLQAIDLLSRNTKGIANKSSGEVYYALYTAYPCDFWFTSKTLAVEFRLRF